MPSGPSDEPGRRRGESGQVDLDERMRRLELEMRRLRQALEAQAGPTGGDAAAREPAAAPPPAGEPAPEESPAPPWESQASGWQPVADGPPTAPPPAPRRARGDLESQIGSRWLPIAGIVIFVLGAVFFLQYAIQQGWIDLMARIVLGVVVGLVLWGAGVALQPRLRVPALAQLLSTGGAAILYFTLFVAHRFPDYQAVTGLSFEVGSVLLGLVALGVLADAALRDSEALSGVGLALLAVTSVAADAWAAFTVVYIVLWTAASMGAAAWRDWPTVRLAAVPVAFLLLAVGLLRGIAPLWVLGGAAALLLVHLGTGLLPRREGEAYDPLHLGAQILAWTGAWALIAAALSLHGWPDASGPVTLAMGLAALGHSRLPALPRPERNGAGLAGLALLVLWPPVQFDGAAMPLAWAAVLAAVSVVAALRSSWTLHGAALAVGGILLVRLLGFDAPGLVAGRVADAMGLAAFAAAAVAFSIGYIVPLALRRTQEPLPWLHLGAALLVPMVYLAAAMDGPAISLAWAVEGAVVLAAGFAVGRQDLRLAGLAVLVPVLLRVFLVDMADVENVWRVLTFLGVGAVLLVVSYFYARSRRGGPAQAP